MLVAWGEFAQSAGPIQEIESVPLHQKTITHRPQTKIPEFFVAIPAGQAHPKDLSRSAHPLTRISRAQVWLLKARPIAAIASTGRGMRAVYDKEGVDPCKCDAHYGECVPVTSFRTGINDDEYGLHQDYEKWLGELAPYAPIRQYRHNDTGEDNADAHLKWQVMGREVVVAVTNGRLDGSTEGSPRWSRFAHQNLWHVGAYLLRRV